MTGYFLLVLCHLFRNSKNYTPIPVPSTSVPSDHNSNPLLSDKTPNKIRTPTNSQRLIVFIISPLTLIFLRNSVPENRIN
jgi:hypothetical protein